MGEEPNHTTERKPGPPKIIKYSLQLQYYSQFRYILKLELFLYVQILYNTYMYTVQVLQIHRMTSRTFTAFISRSGVSFLYWIYARTEIGKNQRRGVKQVVILPVLDGRGGGGVVEGKA